MFGCWPPEELLIPTGPDRQPSTNPLCWMRGGLLLLEQRGLVHAWDLRTGKEAWCLRTSPCEGLLQHMALDPFADSWLVTGSSAGFLGADCYFLMQRTQVCATHDCQPRRVQHFLAVSPLPNRQAEYLRGRVEDVASSCSVPTEFGWWFHFSFVCTCVYRGAQVTMCIVILMQSTVNGTG